LGEAAEGIGLKGMTMDGAMGDRLTLVVTREEDGLAALAQDVKAGLTANPKYLLCRYFYDPEGSRLFDAICDLPEYYLTRTERAILQERAAEIAGLFNAPITLMELGSGSATKTRLLIEALLRQHGRLRYVPVDISQSVLIESSEALLGDYPGLEVVAIAAEYDEGLRQLKKGGDGPKLILWLGSNIGNFERAEAADFLARLRETMTPADRLLVGIDLRKDRVVLEKAYDDPQGVTAQFNLNLLARINRELGADFDLEAFRHKAVYDDEVGRIQMYLVSTRNQSVNIGQLGLVLSFEANEAIHTENSYKYSLEEIEALASAAGFEVEQQWLDSERRFSVNFLGLDTH
jgi:dimethylhistidine N-methyltransferase